jgi:radical SAM superfamily enzyme YgiQ (UPF0313 family)
MKIILAGINARYTHSSPALCYLKKYIEDLDYELIVAEFTIKESPDNIIKSLLFHNPDVIAFSVYIWNSSIIDAVAAKIRLLLPRIIIAAGGPEVSYDPEKYLSKEGAFDYVICGPGEEGFRALALNRFASRERIIRKENPSFSLIPFPYDDEDMLRLKNRFIYYESSRGCPFKCSYCLSSRLDQGCQYRDPGQVKDEIDYICSFKPGLVKFVDRTFNSRKDHYRGIWDYIIKKHAGGGTKFHFEIFPELLSDDDVSFLQYVPPGIFQFEMGIQSTRGETLAAVNRKGDWEKITPIVEKLSAPGNINLHVDLIAGLPFEGYNEFAESYNRVYALNAGHFQCGFLKVLPGTEMREQSRDYFLEYSHDAPYEIFSNKWINEEEMRRLKRISSLTDLIRNSGKFTTSEILFSVLYGSPFSFYEALAFASAETESGDLRSWESIAAVLIMLCSRDFPKFSEELADSLRWDYCSTMKAHHYPEIIKPESAIEIKREGYRFFIERSSGNIITYNEDSFPKDDLRKSIFFRPCTDTFMEKYMRAGNALFLPDKKIIFFDLKPHLSADNQ